MKLAELHWLVSIWLILTCCAGEPAAKLPNCAQFRCEPEAVAFAPEARALGITQTTLARFAAATGRADLRIEESGVPIVFRENLVSDPLDLKPDGAPVERCAITTVAYIPGGPNVTQRIEIDPTPPVGCPNPWLSLLHEMIHALAPNTPHTETGLYAPVIPQGTKTIDETSLIALCSEFACQDFAPEL